MGWEDMCCGAGIVVFGVLCALCAVLMSLAAYQIYATIRGNDKNYSDLCGRIHRLEAQSNFDGPVTSDKLLAGTVTCDVLSEEPEASKEE